MCEAMICCRGIAPYDAQTQRAKYEREGLNITVSLCLRKILHAWVKVYKNSRAAAAAGCPSKRTHQPASTGKPTDRVLCCTVHNVWLSLRRAYVLCWALSSAVSFTVCHRTGTTASPSTDECASASCFRITVQRMPDNVRDNRYGGGGTDCVRENR